MSKKLNAKAKTFSMKKGLNASAKSFVMKVKLNPNAKTFTLKKKSKTKSKTKSKSSSGCKPSTLKKYKKRPSPPIPAPSCQLGTKKRGNNGKMYVVVKFKNSKRWQLSK